MAKWKGFDLYLRYRKSVRGKNGGGASWWFLTAGTVLLCLVTWQALTLRNRGLEEALKPYRDWLNDPDSVSRYAEAEARAESADELERRLNSVGELSDRLSGYPTVDSALLERVAEAGGAGLRVTVRGYDSTTGELLMQAESETALDASDYVEKLEELGLFESISYSGYVWEDGLYRLRLRCVLRAGGGEGA